MIDSAIVHLRRFSLAALPVNDALEPGRRQRYWHCVDARVNAHLDITAASLESFKPANVLVVDDTTLVPVP